MADKKHDDAAAVEPPDARALQAMADAKPGAYRAMVETDPETGGHTIVYQSDAGIEVGREPYAPDDHEDVEEDETDDAGKPTGRKKVVKRKKGR